MKACIDIGGTKVAVSLNRGNDLELLARRSEPTAKTGTPLALAQQVLRMVDEACAELGVPREQVQCAGVASCGPFLLREGVVEVATPNICGGLAGPDRGQLPNDWTSAPLEGPLRARFAQVRVENDGIAALEAERRWGALQGVDDCAYVTWSTGVGMGLCVDGHVLRGKNGNAGHGGHTFASDDDQSVCGCGNVGDVEALVSGSAIARRFSTDAAVLLQRARERDPQAMTIVEDLCRILGRALYNITALLDLRRISLGGSVFLHHRDYLLPLLQAQLTGRLPALTDGCELVPAGLEDRVGDYAALALVA